MAYRILVVEDNAGDREFLLATLAREGYSSLSAITGEEALAQIEQSPPDLVILDIMLPSIDGWETMRRIREFSLVPVLMLTALNREQHEVAGLSSGLTTMW